MAKVGEDKPPHANTFQAFVCIIQNLLGESKSPAQLDIKELEVSTPIEVVVRAREGMSLNNN